MGNAETKKKSTPLDQKINGTAGSKENSTKYSNEEKKNLRLELKCQNLDLKTHHITKDYKINKSVLGAGMGGKVVECTNRKSGDKCALKVLHDDPKARQEIELQWAAGVGASNIVQIFDVYENTYGGVKYLLVVMECMTGGELFSRIEERGEEAFTEREVAKIMFEICKAVQHLHKNNIAHRDLKPENLLYSFKGQNGILKVSDFGFAKKSDTSVAKPLKTPCYTPCYVAPEVLGPEKYDKSCDIWSLGVVMYILLCGAPPFSSGDGISLSPGMKSRIMSGSYEFPSPSWDKVSEDSKSLIRGMLQTDPGQRLTIDEVMEHPWILHFMKVPDTPLSTPAVLNVEKERWSVKQEEIDATLESMRTPALTLVKPLDSGGKGCRLREKRLSNPKVSFHDTVKH